MDGVNPCCESSNWSHSLGGDSDATHAEAVVERENIAVSNGAAAPHNQTFSIKVLGGWVVAITEPSVIELRDARAELGLETTRRRGA